MPEEERYIRCGSVEVRLSRSYIHEGMTKVQGWTKIPDCAIFFGARKPMKSPSIIFEVRFSESYNDLVGDTAQWLLRSSGKVRLVIIVNIKEDVEARKRTQGVQMRRRDLVARFGTSEAKEEVGIDDEDSDIGSTEGLYDMIESSIMVDDWVGPISAVLEVWHIADNGPARRGQPIVSLHYYI